jgi:hypothetical protein
MIRLVRRCGMMVLLVASALVSRPAVAAPIPIPNGSFESPSVPAVYPYVSLYIDNWQREPVPAYWTAPKPLGLGATAQNWHDTVGLYLNMPFDGNGDPAPIIDNLDGAQGVFMFPWPGQGLWQVLGATFEAGQSYHLSALVQGGGTLPLGVPMEIRLFYLDAEGHHVPVGATQILNTNPPNTKIVHFPEYDLDIPTVLPGDAWAGENIGVELISTAGMEVFATLGYQQWEFDYVQLTATPEPATMALLAAGAGLLWARRRRAAARK